MTPIKAQNSIFCRQRIKFLSFFFKNTTFSRLFSRLSPQTLLWPPQKATPGSTKVCVHKHRYNQQGGSGAVEREGWAGAGPASGGKHRPAPEPAGHTLVTSCSNILCARRRAAPANVTLPEHLIHSSAEPASHGGKQRRAPMRCENQPERTDNKQQERCTGP